MVSGHCNVRLSPVIIAPAIITLLFLPLTTVFAQVEEEEVEFLPYDNPTHGIFMEYPSNWIASNSGLENYADVIAFYSPLQNVSDPFSSRLKISVAIYNQSVSLTEYTNLVMSTVNQFEQIDVRNSSEVTVGGHPGHRVVLASQATQNGTFVFYQMNTWTAIGNNVYLLTYEGEESTFNQHLPEVSRMLESLTIEEVI